MADTGVTPDLVAIGYPAIRRDWSRSYASKRTRSINLSAISANGSTAQAASNSAATLGIPNTTLLASSWAMV